MTDNTLDTLDSTIRRPNRLLAMLRGIGLLRESVVGMIGAAMVGFWVLVAVLVPVISPFPPNQQLAPMLFAKPGTEIPAGTFIDLPTGERIEAAGTYHLGGDNLGRDILSRLMWGTQRVLVFASLATGLAYSVGIVMGLAAGYFRGWIDDLLSRLSDLILSFPILVLYVVIITTFGASAINIMLAVVFASSPGIMKIVRGLVLDLRNRDYVAAAQTRGESPWYIMFVEILPNARGPLIVDVCLRLGYTTITIGVLGFLGLGLPPPDPDWGGMINETRSMALFAPHMTIFPCLAISTLVLGLNLLADGLREVSLRD